MPNTKVVVTKPASPAKIPIWLDPADVVEMLKRVDSAAGKFFKEEILKTVGKILGGEKND